MRIEAHICLRFGRSGYGTVVGQRDRLRLRSCCLCGRWVELHSESVYLVGIEACEQCAFAYSSFAQRHLLAVDFARGGDGSCKGDVNLGRGFSIELNQTDDKLIALLGFFQRKNAHAAVIDLEEGKALSQSARMF